MSEQALTQDEMSLARAVIEAVRKLRAAGLARSFVVEVEVKGRQVEVKVRAHVRGFALESA